MTMHDLRPFLESVHEIIACHNLGTPGAYRRWNAQNTAGTRDLGLNPYGCADAANLLYTIGHFPRDPEERESWVEILREFQDPDTGMYAEPTHHEIHTTAHCIAALELFDAAPLHPLAALAPLREPAAMERFLDELDWTENPWNASHRGAGLYAALALAGEVSGSWEDRYFDWLWQEADPATGFLRKGCVAPVRAGDSTSLFPHLAGTFHYLFNQEYARRPLRYPRAMIDSCLDIYHRRSYPLGGGVGFAEIDWVFCLTRSGRQTPHRDPERRAALAAVADDYIGFLLELDPAAHEGLNDLHALFGAVCCLAELQAALPGRIRTERPLRLVLDRRPFI